MISLRSLSPDGWKREIEDCVPKRKLSVLVDAIEMYPHVHNAHGNQHRLAQWLDDALEQALNEGWQEGAGCLCRFKIRSDSMNIFRKLGQHGRLGWALDVASQVENSLVDHPGQGNAIELIRGAISGGQHETIKQTITTFPNIWNSERQQQTFLAQAVATARCTHQMLDDIFNHCLATNPHRKDHFHQAVIDALRHPQMAPQSAVWVLNNFKHHDARRDNQEILWHLIATALVPREEMMEVLNQHLPQDQRQWDAILPVIGRLGNVHANLAIKDIVQSQGDVMAQLLWSWRVVARMGVEHILFAPEELARLSKDHENTLFLTNGEKTENVMQWCLANNILSDEALMTISQIEHLTDTPERRAWQQRFELHQGVEGAGAAPRKKLL